MAADHHAPCSMHDFRYTSLQMRQPPYDFDPLVASASTTQLFVKFFIRIKHRYLYVSADGTTRIRRAPPTVKTEESLFRLSTFNSYPAATQKLSEMLSRIFPAHYYPDPWVVLPRVFDYGVQIANHPSNARRKVLPLFAEIDAILLHVIDYRRVTDFESIPESEESSDHGMVPASESAVKALVKRVRVGEEDEEEEESGSGRKRRRMCTKDETCPICLNEFDEERSCANVVKMPCSHLFHEDCLKLWLNRSHSCPLCRYELPISTSN